MLLVLLTSCNSVEPEKLNCDKDIIIDNNLFVNAPNDSLKFLNVELSQDCLKLTVEYGGGCGNIEFQLIASELIMKSNPPQMNIRLSFLNEDDTCFKVGRSEISFDLTPIKNLDLIDNKVILHLAKWDKAISYSF